MYAPPRVTLHRRAPAHRTAADQGVSIRALTDRDDRRLERETASVTLTITTCKRLDLFEMTMRSFLRCCTDAARIRRWICVDDDSSPSDRARMREGYPFEYVWKGPDERGHARSMNLLRDKVDERPTEFVLHLEDDWEFLEPHAFVSDAIAILRHDDDLGQVVFNRHYAEAPGERYDGGVHVAASPGEHPAYIVHEHYPFGSEEYAAAMRRAGGRPSQAYWPHYSLQPSLVRFGVWRALGRFDEQLPAVQFEREYAERYCAAGWRTAFFSGISARHIGRQRAEWNSTTKHNAYALNVGGVSERRLRGPAPRV
jgi:hypothetical protein